MLVPRLPQQLSLKGVLDEVVDLREKDVSAFFSLLKEHLDIASLIPLEFYQTYHSHLGRNRSYPLSGMVSAFLLQKFIGISQDSVLLTFLSLCQPARMFCDLAKVPSASRFSRFKTEFYEQIHAFFDSLVDLVNPICLEMDQQKTAQISYDTTGIEGYVQENNPKYLNGIIRRLKYAMRFYDNAEEFDPYKAAYRQMPAHAAANPEFSQQYINGKFCYALRCGILTNGFGLPVAFEFFDQEFKDSHPEIPVEKKIDSPDEDKSLGDARTLAPVLHQYVQRHPDAPLHTFLGDAAFDSLHCYDLLLNELPFKRAVIPLNGRSGNDLPPLAVNEAGQPLCPKDPALPMKYEGVLREKSGLLKQKWVCPKMTWKGKKRICQCADPCTDKPSGRMFYTHDLKQLRLFPGIRRDSEEFLTLYNHRSGIERRISHLKVALHAGEGMTQCIRSLKSDVCLAGIAVLMTVILAKVLHNRIKLGSVRSILDLIA
jgi:hypothetical protein